MLKLSKTKVITSLLINEYAGVYILVPKNYSRAKEVSLKPKEGTASVSVDES